MKISDHISEITSVPGLKVWVAETSLKEGIVLRGSLPGGRSEAPLKRREVAGLTTELFDEGTRRHTRDALRNLLLELGATVDFRCGSTRIDFTVICITERFEAVTKLLAEMLFEPAFTPVALKAVRAKLVGQLSETKLDSRVQAAAALSRSLYSSTSPLYAPKTSTQLTGLTDVTREDITRHHEATVEKGDFHLIVAGDVTAATAGKAIKKYFGGKLRATTSIIVPESPRQSIKRTSTFPILTIPDKANVDTFWGSVPGITKAHPDYIPLTVALQILGGGFMGRLMQEVREKRGLTYVVYSRGGGFESGLPGYWYIWATFGPKVFREGVTQVENVLKEFVRGGVTAKEVETKKTRIAGRLKVSCSSTQELSGVLLTLLDDGRSVSYIDDYLAEVEAVTHEDVERVITRYFQNENIARYAAGAVNEKGLPLTA